MSTENVIEVARLRTELGGKTILEGIDLTIHRGEIIAIVGGSGAGKSTLLRCMIMLQPFSEGQIVVLGHNIAHLNAAMKHDLQRQWGVLFQQGALFSSMSVAQNVEFPLRKHTKLNKEVIAELARLKITLTGLAREAGIQYPSELSGGMQKRAALARALALDPELLFLDEPTAGLDPESANAFDELILNLRASLNLTIVIVTHDLDTLWQTADRVAFLAEGRLIAVDTMPNLVKSEHALIKRYFNGPRARLAQVEYE